MADKQDKTDKADKIYKFALIGAGRWGKAYINTINEMENVEIAHLVTSHPDNAKLIKNRVRIHAKYSDLFGLNGIDGAIIATPPDTHSDIMYDCIHHLIPVMCEKPLCLNVENAERLSAFIKSVKVPCLVDHTQIFSPAFKGLAALFKTDKVKKITSKVSSFGPFRKGLSMLWDWAPHDVAMCLYLTKEYNPTVSAAKLISHPNYDNSGQLSIDLQFKNCTANISINNLATSKFRSFQAASNIKTMSMFDDELYEIRASGEQINRVHTSNDRPLKCAVEAFVEAIEGGDFVGLDLAVDTVKILAKADSIITKQLLLETK